MKFSAVTIAFNEEKLIQGVIKCLQPFVDEHIVLLQDKDYYGNGKPDRTGDIAESLGAYVIRGEWKTEHEKRNFGQKLCKDSDWIFIFDADELMKYEDIVDTIHAIEQNPHVAGLMTNTTGYWKTTDYVLSPPPDCTPIILVKPEVMFFDCRNIATDKVSVYYKNESLHHLSWCEPKDILQKVLSYGHAKLFDGKLWYEQHYKYWKVGDPVILPSFSHIFNKFEAVYQPLPKELHDKLL